MMVKSKYKFIEAMIPIYGDIQIHKLYSKKREESKRRLEEITPDIKLIDGQETIFRKELSDLLKKYDIKEEMGSYISFPSNFISKKRENIEILKTSSTITPEIMMYLMKYGSLIIVSYGLYDLISR